MPSIGLYHRSDRLLNCLIGATNLWVFKPWKVLAFPLENSGMDMRARRGGVCAEDEDEDEDESQWGRLQGRERPGQPRQVRACNVYEQYSRCVVARTAALY